MSEDWGIPRKHTNDEWEIAQELEDKLVRISELLDQYQNCMESIGGCGDGNRNNLRGNTHDILIDVGEMKE